MGYRVYPKIPEIQYCLVIFLLGTENSNTKQDQTRPGKNFLHSIVFFWKYYFY